MIARAMRAWPSSTRRRRTRLPAPSAPMTSGAWYVSRRPTTRIPSASRSRDCTGSFSRISMPRPRAASARAASELVAADHVAEVGVVVADRARRRDHLGPVHGDVRHVQRDVVLVHPLAAGGMRPPAHTLGRGCRAFSSTRTSRASTGSRRCSAMAVAVPAGPDPTMMAGRRSMPASWRARQPRGRSVVRAQATMSSVLAPGVKISQIPFAFSSAISSGGMMPPPKMGTSSPPRSRATSGWRGTASCARRRGC